MAHYDSLGNRYDRLPSRKDPPKAKPTHVKTSKRRLKKGGRNERKYAKYFSRKGHFGVKSRCQRDHAKRYR